MTTVKKVGMLPTDPYRRYLPSAFDESMNIYEQLITCIEHVNNLGISFNELVDWLDKVVLQQNEKLKEQDEKIEFLKNEWKIFEDYVINVLLEKKVVEVLKQWLEDGTLAEIINEEVFNMKADKTWVEEQFKQLKINTVYVDDFPKLEGETDDTPRLKRAFEELKKSNYGEILFGAKKYEISDVLEVPSNRTVRGFRGKTVIDATKIPKGTALNQKYAFSVVGTASDPITVIGSIPKMGTIIGVAGCDLILANDLIKVMADDPYTPGAPDYLKKGEMFIVKKCDQSSVTIKDRSYFEYPEGKNTRLQKIFPAKNITFQDFSLIMGGVGSTHSGIYVRFAQDVLIKNLYIDGAEDMGINLEDVYNVQVHECEIENNTSPTGIGNTGYGVGILASKYVQVKDSTIRNSRHAIAGGGVTPALYVQIYDNEAMYCPQYAFDCHEPCFMWVFKGNRVTACVGGFTIRGQFTVVEGNSIYGCSQNGILVESYTPVNEQIGTTIVGNKIHTTYSNAIFIDGSNALQKDILVSDNFVEDNGLAGVRATNFKNLTINGNSIRKSNQNGIQLIGEETKRCKNVNINGNTIQDSRFAGVRVDYVDQVNIIGSNAVTSSKHGVEVTNSNDVTIQGGVLDTSDLYGVFISTSKRISVSSLIVRTVTGATSDGIRVIGSESITLNGNTVSAVNRHGVYISGSQRGIVTNNNLYDVPSTSIEIENNVETFINQNNLLSPSSPVPPLGV